MSIPNLLENVSNYLKDLKLDYKSSAKYLNEIEVYNILEMAGVITDLIGHLMLLQAY